MSKGIAITYQFLEEQLVDIAKVWENFYMGREVTKKIGPIKLLNVSIMRNLTKKIIDKYRLGFEETREVKDLSGGQRQLVAVSRAVESDEAFGKPLKVLLLDEPYTGLSVRVTNEIFDYVKRLSERGVSVIIAAQWFDRIKDVVDEVIVMRLGKIAGRFSIEEADKQMIYKLAIGSVQ